MIAGDVRGVGRHDRRILVILGALTATGPLAIDMYLPALPSIARDLGAPAGLVQASLAAYFIGIALGQALYGPLSDGWGRKPALYLGLSIFIAGSLGCAVAPRIEWLIVCRLVQALGGCAPLVVPRAVVRDRFDQQASVRALSALVLVMGLAPILAPLVGGQLLVRWGWRAVFVLLAGHGALWLAVVAFRLPETLPAAARRPPSPGAIVRAYGGLATDRSFMGWVLSGGLIFAGLLSYIAGSPFVFIELFGVRPERFGFFFGANAVGLIAASQVNRRLARRWPPERVLAVVMPVAAVAGTTLLVAAVTGVGGLWGIVGPLFCFVACHGFSMPNTTALAMAAHGRQAGNASALLGTVQFALGAIGGGLIGYFSDGTARPFGAVIALCGVGAWLVFRTMAKSPRTA